MSIFGKIGKAIGSAGKTVGGIALGGAGIALNTAATAASQAVRIAGPQVLPTGAVSFAPDPQRSTQIQLPSIGPGGISLGGFQSITTVPTPTATKRPVDPETGKPKRRMNPLNGKALRRSMRRLESFKRASNVANRITIRGKSCK